MKNSKMTLIDGDEFLRARIRDDYETMKKISIEAVITIVHKRPLGIRSKNKDVPEMLHKLFLELTDDYVNSEFFVEFPD